MNSLLKARGYPPQTSKSAADVSVNYPRVMDNYRFAHKIAAHIGGSESTEELRNAMIQYRSIFDELVQSHNPGIASTAA